MEVARSVKEEMHREIRLMLPIKLGNQTRRRREAQSRSPFACFNHRQGERIIPPRVIQIEMFEMFHQSAEQVFVTSSQLSTVRYAIIAIRSSLCAQLPHWARS